MRLHHLTVSAFGPFPDTVEVDLDALSGAGLFLLSGPTGAGKTSVLDAICFALYGAVPGDRNDGRRLRCDTAPAGVTPEVTLDLTISGRRFRVTRSPAWERPKRRGSGTTMQQASVLVQERTADDWVHLSSRLDETGHLVTSLLGMNLPQFCQVAMLPQGQFQAFLRAKSEDRQKLLQQLFRTRRFEDIERWMRDHRLALRRSSLAHEQRAADVVSRLSEAAAVGLPDAWGLDDLAPPFDSGGLERWAEELTAGAGAAAVEARDRATRSEEDELVARETLERAKVLAERRIRLSRARTDAAALDGEATEVAAGRERLAAARAAAPVQAVLTMVRDAAQAHQHALTRAGQLAPGLSLVELDDRITTTGERIARARGVLPTELEKVRLQAAVEARAGRLAELDQITQSLTLRLDVLPGEVEAAQQALVDATTAEAALPGERSRLAELRARVAAAETVATLEAQLAIAQDELQICATLCLHLKEQWLAIRESRLEGMAAEIAGALASGESCPVCGSHEHPDLARALPGAPDADAERLARRRLDDAEVARVAHEGKTRELGTALALARAQAGAEPPGASAVDELGARVERLALCAAGADRQRRAAAALATELDKARAEVAHAAVARARLDAEQAGDHAQLAACAAAVDEVLGDHPSLTDLVATLETDLARLNAARDARLEAQARAERLAAAEAALGGCLADCGFDDADGARAAMLPESEIARLENDLRVHDDRRAAVAAVLSDPEIVAAADADPPDLPGLTHAHQLAAARLAEHHSSASTSARAASRIAQLRTTLDAELASWGPVRAGYALADQLASFVEGKSADNTLKMRLSAYVLAFRLGQVVAAANERLSRMSDQRYALEHTGDRGAGETRGGLSLLVRDEWSGEARDPVTLSGGETFVVSLALALGLADVVSREAGGTEIDTLFVDEGFGSLDQDTLDDVMDTLDQLRDGGRCVGVVSHVAELRSRIPTRLQVEKARSGSTLRLVHGVG